MGYRSAFDVLEVVGFLNPTSCLPFIPILYPAYMYARTYGDVVAMLPHTSMRHLS